MDVSRFKKAAELYARIIENEYKDAIEKGNYSGSSSSADSVSMEMNALSTFIRICSKGEFWKEETEDFVGDLRILAEETYARFQAMSNEVFIASQPPLSDEELDKYIEEERAKYQKEKERENGE